MTTEAITPLRQRMIEDMDARKLGKDTQRGHVYSCKRFAAFLNRSPDTATAEDIRRFQLHLSARANEIASRVACRVVENVSIFSLPSKRPARRGRLFSESLCADRAQSISHDASSPPARPLDGL